MVFMISFTSEQVTEILIDSDSLALLGLKMKSRSVYSDIKQMSNISYHRIVLKFTTLFCVKIQNCRKVSYLT